MIIEILRTNLTTILISLACLVGFGYIVYYKEPDDGRKRVALLYINSSEPHRLIMRGVHEAWEKSPYKDQMVLRDYHFPMGDRVTLNQVIEAIIMNDLADIILTTGQQATQAIASVARRRHYDRPIVFCGVLDPIKLGVVTSLENHNGTITGSMAPTANYERLGRIMKIIKPSMKSVLIPYDVTGPARIFNEEYAHTLAASLNAQGIKTDIIAVDNLSLALTIVLAKLPGHDSLVTLESDPISNLWAGIGKKCSERGYTFFSEYYGAEETAAITIADSIAINGERLFAYGIDILFNNVKPQDIPITPATRNQSITINAKAAARQDMQTPLDIERIKQDLRASEDTAAFADRITIV